MIIISATEPASASTRLHVYPNPATDQVRVRLASSALETPGLQVLDENGRLFYEQTVLSPMQDGYETTFSVRSLKSGHYVLRVTTKDGPVSTRLLIRP